MDSSSTLIYTAELILCFTRTVLNTSSQDAGNYTCDVTNAVGNSSDTTVIVMHEGVFYCTKQIIQRVYAVIALMFVSAGIYVVSI